MKEATAAGANGLSGTWDFAGVAPGAQDPALEPTPIADRQFGVGGRGGPWYTGYRRLALATDIVVSLIAGGLGVVTSLGSGSMGLRFGVAVVLPLVWVPALAASHGYARRYLGTTSQEFSAVVRASVAVFVGLAFLSYVVRFQVARGVMVIVLPSLLVLGLLGRHLLRRRLNRRRLVGLDVQRTVIIGDERTVKPMIRQINRSPGEGLLVVAACLSGIARDADAPSSLEGVPVFGYPDDAMSVVDLLDADVVAVSSDPVLHGPALRRLAWDLEERDVELVLAPGLFEVAGPRLTIRPGEGMPLLHVERPVVSGVRRVLKAVLDRTIAAIVVVVCLPMVIAISLAIRVDSPGPILFRQKRVGARGEQFSMLKFRTMVVDAESRRTSLEAVADAGNSVMFKMRQDPRITRVGRLLRRYSLDELPQLVNVVRGEMSLVGPRPPLPQEVARYESDAVRKLRVRPGLTGLWQVSGRSDLPWEESLRLDLWYVDNWSLVLDAQIIARTVRAVAGGSGAY